jgi:ADP-ribosylation factor related protein 1
MFTLLNGFYEELTFVPERRVVLLGLQSSGKTALIECMKMHYLRKPNHGLFSSVSSRAGKPGLPTGKLKALTPTVGLNVARLPTGRENVLVWDLGGAEALRPIWERYVSEAEALIWVVDSSDSAAIATLSSSGARKGKFSTRSSARIREQTGRRRRDGSSQDEPGS